MESGVGKKRREGENERRRHTNCQELHESQFREMGDTQQFHSLFNVTSNACVSDAISRKNCGHYFLQECSIRSITNFLLYLGDIPDCFRCSMSTSSAFFRLWFFLQRLVWPTNAFILPPFRHLERFFPRAFRLCIEMPDRQTEEIICQHLWFNFTANTR